MSQRETLIAGAKKCLAEKGYSGTTARDIAAAANANLGSISYYFGSKDRLMNLAAVELSSEWGDTLEAAARAAGGATRAERLTAVLTALLELPRAGDAQAASLVALAQSQFDDELRAEIAAGHANGRAALAAIVLGTPSADEQSAQGLGTLVYALVTGLVAQSVVDPESLPDAAALAAAVRALLDE